MSNSARFGSGGPGSCRTSSISTSSPVASRPAQCRLQPADLLLRHLDRIEAAAGDLERKGSELAQRVADALEEVRVLLCEETCADVAPRLLVGEEGEDHVAGQRRVLL